MSKLTIFLVLIVVIACATADDPPRLRCRKSKGQIAAVARRHVCEWKCASVAGKAPKWVCERPTEARCVCNHELDFCRSAKQGKCLKMKKRMG